jgi:hypothetical protein
MYYINLQEEAPDEWYATYYSGTAPKEVDVLLHSVSRYGVYTVIKSNTPYWVVGSTIKVRKP